MAAALNKLGPAEEQPVDFDAGEMISNIPGSAMQLGSDIWDAVTSPVQTAKGVAALGGSALAKGQRKIQELASGVDIEAGEDEAIADSVWDAAVGRYGGIDELKKTIMYDPVGFLSDFSGALGAAGRVGKAGKLAQVANMVDPAMIPVIIAKKAIKHGVSPDTARSMYQSAAKFSNTMRKRDEVTQIALDRRIMPNKRGVAKVEKHLASRENALNKIIDDATESGQQIPVEKVYQHLGGLLDDKGGFKAEGILDQDKIIQVMSNADDTLKGRTHVSPRELQDFKTDLYDKLYMRRTDPSPVKQRGPKTEAQSAMARGAKDVISDHVPGSAAINKDLSDLYTIRAPVTRSANRIQNANKIPARAMFGGAAAGGAAAGNPALAAVMAATSFIVDHPQVKGRMALAINSIRRGDVGKAEQLLKGTQEIRAALALADRNNEELEELGITLE
jgi:hypothetical protein